MAVIITRSARLTQPQGLVEVAPYWLGRAPVLVASGGGGFVNVVNGKPPTLGSTTRFQASAVGVGANGTSASTTSSILFEDYDFGGTTPITALAFSDERPSANRSFLGQDTEVILRVSAAGTGVEWILNSFATNDRATAVANSRASPGFFAAGTYGPSGRLRAYANTAMAEVTPTGSYANATGLFSAVYTQGLNQLFDKKLALVALFRAELSQAELRALSENPWQLFKPVQRRVVFLPAGGGGPGGIDASSSMSTGQALLSAAGALPVAGSASLTSGAATMSAAGDLQGSADGTASMTTAPASLGGTGALLISGSAAMSTLAAMLSASGSLPIVASGAMATGASVMSADGTVGSDATASASMATGPATVSASGSLPITATAAQTTGAAVMAATGDLAGSVDGSASMATAPATLAGQGLLHLLAAAGMQTSTPILVAFGSEPSTGPAIDWAAPGARALVPQANIRAVVKTADVRAIVPFAGADMDIIKTFDHQVGDTEIYELAYGQKYLDPLADTPATLAAFNGGHAGITPEVSVGAASDATVKFAVDGTVPVGSYTVSAQLATAAGRKKTAAVLVNVEA